MAFSTRSVSLASSANRYVDIPHDAGQNSASAFSWSGWIKNQTGVATFDALGTKWTFFSDGGWVISLGSVITRPFLFIARNPNDSSGFQLTTTSDQFTLDQWHHVVWTFGSTGPTAGNAKIYVDGVEVASSTAAPGAILASGANQRIGRWSGALTRNYTGLMDEVSTWARELTLAEVQELYNDGEPADLALHSRFGDLLSWYTFEESGDFGGAGSNDITDRSANGFDGVLVNGSVANQSTDVPVNLTPSRTAFALPLVSAAGSAEGSTIITADGGTVSSPAGLAVASLGFSRTAVGATLGASIASAISLSAVTRTATASGLSLGQAVAQNIQGGSDVRVLSRKVELPTVIARRVVLE